MIVVPDRKIKVRIGFYDQNYIIKSGIIHVWAEVAAIFVFFQNGGPLGGARVGARQKSKQYAIGDI